MKKLLLYLFVFLFPLITFGQWDYLKRKDTATAINPIIPTIIASHYWADSRFMKYFVVQYECDPILSSGIRYQADTIYIDTCYTSSSDTNLWYDNAGVIQNKSRKTVVVDSAFRIPFPHHVQRVGYVLIWEHTTGNVFPVPVAQFMDTGAVSGGGAWTRENDHIFPADNIDSVYAKIINTDTIINQERIDSICRWEQSYLFYLGDDYYIEGDEYSFTLTEGEYDIQIGDSIIVTKTCVDVLNCVLPEYDCMPEEPALPDSCNLVDTISSVRSVITSIDILEGTLIYTADVVTITICEDIFCPHKPVGFISAEVFHRVCYDTLIDNPVVIHDSALITGNAQLDAQVYAPNLDSNETSRQLYYDTSDGKITYGMVASGDTCLWYETGNFLYPKNLSDNIGIGTATPTEKLDVNGNINIPATTATVGQIKQAGTTIFHTYHEKGDNNLFIGQGAGNFTADSSFNVGIGKLSLSTLTTGYDNTSIGINAGNTLTTGYDNTFMGKNSGYNIIGGIQNVAVGSGAMNITTNTTYSSPFANIAIGYSALQFGVIKANHNNNVGIGQSSGSGLGNNSTVASAMNTFIGDLSGYYAGGTTGASSNFNIGIGYEALYFHSKLSSTSSSYNIAIGTLSMGNTTAYTVGNYNIAIGRNILNKSYSGCDSNIIIGNYAGINLSSGDNNILIGKRAGGLLTTESNKLYIENSNSATPLIYGDFAADTVRLNSTLSVRDMATVAKPYFVVVGNDGRYTKMDTAGFVGGGVGIETDPIFLDQVGDSIQAYNNLYKEQLAAPKTVYTTGFTITDKTLVFYNGQPLQDAQWAGIGTETLTIYLDTRQYDYITIKQ